MQRTRTASPTFAGRWRATTRACSDSKSRQPPLSVTLSGLRLRSGSESPDFEKPGDLDEDNVYEVTIVVKDGTVDMNGNPHRDELPVTVKVINSTEDNEPGEVKFSNRVPEVATPLTATHEDEDGPSTELEWQWYRSVGRRHRIPYCVSLNTPTARGISLTHTPALLILLI